MKFCNLPLFEFTLIFWYGSTSIIGFLHIPECLWITSIKFNTFSRALCVYLDKKIVTLITTVFRKSENFPIKKRGELHYVLRLHCFNVYICICQSKSLTKKTSFSLSEC